MNQKYEEFIQSLIGKKIAVIGLGVSNIPLISILTKIDCKITVFDKRSLSDMTKEVVDLINKYNIETSLGEDYLSNLNGFDVIFRSPSMLPTNEYLVSEQKRGAIITTEVEQVIKLSPCKVIGITGSKGKTTTTTILNDILVGMGYSTYLGGNIGTPLFDKLGNIKSDDIVVLELSSFQLMNMEVSPNIAVVTNISPDHLDIHGGYDEYIEAKKYIFKNQSKNDILVLNMDDEIVSTFIEETKGSVRYFKNAYTSDDIIKDNYILRDNYIIYNDEKVIDTNNLILRGKHNYLNICAALNAIKDYINIDNNKLEDIIKNINSVKHRLEFVREINGVKWYNDSASTTPDKSLAGINAFDEDIILIAGGYDKNISYEPLAKPILDKVSKLILFGATKDKIYEAVMNEIKNTTNPKTRIYLLDTIEEVISVANKISEPGEVVLFSPASASFDMFKNAYSRGDIFKSIVEKL